MERYNEVAQAAARGITDMYSTSFGTATRLLPVAVRADIYNIYGMVRMADEIVDSYRGTDMKQRIDGYEQAVYDAIGSGFSSDVVLHAFQLTAHKCRIGADLIKPFFDSMRMDISPKQSYTEEQYKTYIYGSAEVVGLMCLKVFCAGDEAEYEQLKNGAMALGSAFQKVNFLRDYAHDTVVLKRNYFPDVVSALSDDDKDKIITDIESDFALALPSLMQLPRGVRPAVLAAYQYYHKLLNKLARTPATEIAKKRIRISNSRKAILLARTYTQARVTR